MQTTFNTLFKYGPAKYPRKENLPALTHSAALLAVLLVHPHAVTEAGHYKQALQYMQPLLLNVAEPYKTWQRYCYLFLQSAAEDADGGLHNLLQKKRAAGTTSPPPIPHPVLGLCDALLDITERSVSADLDYWMQWFRERDQPALLNIVTQFAIYHQLIILSK